MRTLTVDLGERSYPIYIGPDLIKQGLLDRHITDSRALLITNETVGPRYRGQLVTPENVSVTDLVLPDGERYKTLTTCERVYDSLISGRFDRSATIIALGGGVIGDLAGFCAATYQRGINFVQIPTTLLAQVDSSVGGKTGVNHPQGKNMIGAFHQPQAVIADTYLLGTLPERELAAGLAEVVKYGLIRDPEFFSWLERNADKLLAKDADALAHAVAESCRNKAEVVAADEREGGVRALLNLGHTFGHAIETYTNYSTWLHGEAVAVGICMACRVSVELGWLCEADLQRTQRLLAKLGLPQRPPNIPLERFLELMSVDKKSQGGRIRLVLLKGIGDALVTSEFDHGALHRSIETT
ncbi:3-dehydroquinate synthase [Halorhodospira halochloris]|uniref:3-dehydroquinate synthase n=1 Tax=Halorhodospira halochloris TaxID=1052 RepID=UPI001EE85999|nr:3-dehydroquinate synthase [Halorhodospira halochloris]MCG5549060.1 3-dehydroquinate synthase [Halorhodospira halochloris]